MVTNHSLNVVFSSLLEFGKIANDYKRSNCQNPLYSSGSSLSVNNTCKNFSVFCSYPRSYSCYLVSSVVFLVYFIFFFATSVCIFCFLSFPLRFLATGFWLSSGPLIIQQNGILVILAISIMSLAK
jgi:hypothetical protein